MTENGTVRIGIVGCGQMGRKHAVNCSRIEGVSVVAVADALEDRAMAVAGEVRAIPYQSAEAMMGSVELDAVVIATPPGLRREALDRVVAESIPVLVEIPIALDAASAKAFCAGAQKASIVNSAGFQLRYSPLTQRARNLLTGRRLSHVRTLTTTPAYLKLDMPPWSLQRRHSGGPLLQQTLHMMDTARYLAGEITHVAGWAHRLVRPDLRQFDSEDTVVLSYRFDNGALGVATDSCAHREFNCEIEVLGHNLRLLVDYARRRLRGYIGDETIQVDVPDIDIHMLEMQAFLDAVRQRRQELVLSSFADATKTLAVALAGDRAIRTGEWELVIA